MINDNNADNDSETSNDGSSDRDRDLALFQSTDKHVPNYK